jgi:hypothetical protein
MGSTVGLECRRGRVGIDGAQASQQLVHLHDPKRIAAKIPANATS